MWPVSFDTEVSRKFFSFYFVNFVLKNKTITAAKGVGHRMVPACGPAAAKRDLRYYPSVLHRTSPLLFPIQYAPQFDASRSSVNCFFH